MAGIMMAAMSITSFAASTDFWDEDGYGILHDDGTVEYYNTRKKSYTVLDSEGSIAAVDRRGNITYYDGDTDSLYYVTNNSKKSSSSKKNSSRKNSSSRNRVSGNGRVYNDRNANPTSSSSGWQCNNGVWKYKRTNGTFASNCWEQVNGKWYSFDGNGNMRANQWVRNTTNEHVWYYVGNDGAMVKNTTVDGYFINASGECYC